MSYEESLKQADATNGIREEVVRRRTVQFIHYGFIALSVLLALVALAGWLVWMSGYTSGFTAGQSAGFVGAMAHIKQGSCQ